MKQTQEVVIGRCRKQTQETDAESRRRKQVNEVDEDSSQNYEQRGCK